MDIHSPQVVFQSHVESVVSIGKKMVAEKSSVSSASFSVSCSSFLKRLKALQPYLDSKGTVDGCQTAIVALVELNLFNVVELLKGDRDGNAVLAAEICASTLDVLHGFVASKSWDDVTSSSDGFLPKSFVERIFDLLFSFKNLEDEAEKEMRQKVKWIVHKMYLKIVPLRSLLRKKMRKRLKYLSNLNEGIEAPRSEVIGGVPKEMGRGSSIGGGIPKTIPPSQMMSGGGQSFNAARDAPVKARGFGYLDDATMIEYQGIAEVLDIVSSIIRGATFPLHEEFSTKLLQAIVPLHAARGLISEFVPTIGLYHKELTYCMVQYVQKDPAMAQTILGAVLNMWPTHNDKSAVLLIGEIESILENITSEQFKKFSVPLSRFLAKAGIANLNYTVALKAAVLFSNEYIVSLFSSEPDVLGPILAPALISTCIEQFSDTCRQMCWKILENFSQYDKSIEGMSQFLELKERFAQRKQREDEEELRKKESMATRKKGLRMLDFGLGRTLGEGSYSIVKWAALIQPGVDQRFWAEYAMKIMDKELLEEQQYTQNALNEISILESLQHPNIVNFISSFEDERRYFLITEYASRGDIFELLTGMGSFSEKYSKFVLSQIILALDHIHSKGFIHLDIKPENVLITSDGGIKLTDFGSIQKYSEDVDLTSSIQGTAEYVAPELVAGKGKKVRVTTATDFWALGCLLFQLLAGFTPFHAHSQDRLFDKILEDTVIFPTHFSDDAKSVISGLLNRNPQDRLNSASLKSHPFFKDVDFEVSTAEPPQSGATLPSQIDPKVKQRKFSMLLSVQALGSKYNFRDIILDPIPQEDPM